MAAPSKAWVCWNCVFESHRGAWMSLVIVVCCQGEVCPLGWSLVQRSPTECRVSECDREASIMMRPWPTRGCCSLRGGVRICIFSLSDVISVHLSVSLPFFFLIYSYFSSLLLSLLLYYSRSLINKFFHSQDLFLWCPGFKIDLRFSCSCECSW